MGFCPRASGADRFPTPLPYPATPIPTLDNNENYMLGLERIIQPVVADAQLFLRLRAFVTSRMSVLSDVVNHSFDL